jgi:putative ABC transport system permease protein
MLLAAGIIQQHALRSDPTGAHLISARKEFQRLAIQFLILSIGAVVFFTLLLVTGNTMAIAIRERTGELAIFKAIGFSDLSLLLIVLAESLVISLIGSTWV